jgi:hypothetical protein
MQGHLYIVQCGFLLLIETRLAITYTARVLYLHGPYTAFFVLSKFLAPENLCEISVVGYLCVFLFSCMCTEKCTLWWCDVCMRFGVILLWPCVRNDCSKECPFEMECGCLDVWHCLFVYITVWWYRFQVAAFLHVAAGVLFLRNVCVCEYVCVCVCACAHAGMTKSVFMFVCEWVSVCVCVWTWLHGMVWACACVHVQTIMCVYQNACVKRFCTMRTHPWYA